MDNIKVTISSSDSWLESLIESLKDSEYAAEYLTVALEGKLETNQSLRYAIKDVVEAHEKMNNLSEEAKINYEKLDKILSEGGGSEIKVLVNLIQGLGFELVVSPKN